MYLIINCPKPHDHITLGVCVLYRSTDLDPKLMVIFAPRFPKKMQAQMFNAAIFKILKTADIKLRYFGIRGHEIV